MFEFIDALSKKIGMYYKNFRGGGVKRVLPTMKCKFR